MPELFMHRSDSLQILIEHAVDISTALSDVMLDASREPYVIRRLTQILTSSCSNTSGNTKTNIPSTRMTGLASMTSPPLILVWCAVIARRHDRLSGSERLELFGEELRVNALG